MSCPNPNLRGHAHTSAVEVGRGLGGTVQLLPFVDALVGLKLPYLS